MAEVQAHGTAEDGALEVASLADHVLDGITVRNAGDFLFDDWTLIQTHGHVMTRGADQLHSTQEGLMIRLGADEGRKK